MHLKQLVNDKECYDQFIQHIDDLIYLRQRTMESANDAVIVYRQQGAIDVLRKLKLLRETLNNGT
jgi:protein-arginine kinase activator protein McsA